MRVILASTSPRRREILASLGTPFEVMAPDFEEQISTDLPIEYEVLQFAVGKAQSVASKNPNTIVIGSDTMIRLDGKKIGKPRNADDARRILCALSGKTHTIYTSVAIIDGTGGAGLRRVETVLVTMRDLAPGDIEKYLAKGESLDKAGAYSIQGHGRGLIARVEGDYLAAVGMPIEPIAEYLEERGLKLRCDPPKFYRGKTLHNFLNCCVHRLRR